MFKFETKSVGLNKNESVFFLFDGFIFWWISDSEKKVSSVSLISRKTYLILFTVMEIGLDHLWDFIVFECLNFFSQLGRKSGDFLFNIDSIK